MWGVLEVWGEIRSPVLAAPSFANFTRLIASCYQPINWNKSRKLKSCSTGSNNLCEKHLATPKRLADSFRGKGIDFEDLEAAAHSGLALASTKFDPELKASFGSSAKFWIEGEVRRSFKLKADAIASGRRSNHFDAPLNNDNGYNSASSLHEVIAAERTPPSLDLSDLSDEENETLFHGSAAGETLNGTRNRSWSQP